MEPFIQQGTDHYLLELLGSSKGRSGVVWYSATQTLSPVSPAINVKAGKKVTLK